MSQEIIKEFLVSLGYRIDPASEKELNKKTRKLEGDLKKNSEESEKSLKQFVGTVAGRAAAVTAALSAAAVAMTAVVARVAEGFEQLYYSSQRTGATVANIKAFGYAISQMGGTVDGARSSLENFAQKLRRSPGYYDMLKSLGVQTRDANGKLRDSTELLADLGKVLAKKEPFEALAFADVLGIDEATLKALMDNKGDLRKFMEESAAAAKKVGLDNEAAAKNSKEFMRELRSLQLMLETVVQKIASDLTPTMVKYMGEMREWFEKNGDAIGKAIAYVADAVARTVKVLGDLVVAIKPVTDGFDAIAQSLTGQSGLQVAFEAFALYLTTKWLVRILGAFAAVGGGFAGMLLRLGMSPAGALALGGAAVYAGVESHRDFQRRADAIEKPGGRDPFGAIDERDKNRFPKKDTRSFWQRHAPKWLGGKDAPAGGGDSGKAGGDSGASKGSRQMASAGIIPVEGRALLDTVASTEAQDYNVMYGGRKFSAYSDHPRVNHLITSGPNAGKTSSAAGRYQFLASTWDEQARKLGLKDFSPRSQDIAAWDLAKTTYHGNTGRDLEADLKSGDQELMAGIGGALSGRWTSLPGGIEQGQGTSRMQRSFLTALARQKAAAEGQTQSSVAPSAPQGQGLSRLKDSDLPPAVTRLGDAAMRAADIQRRIDDVFSNDRARLMPSGTTNDNSQSLSLNPVTNITVMGSGDPSAIGSSIAGHQSRVNADLLRNTQGAFR